MWNHDACSVLHSEEDTTQIDVQHAFELVKVHIAYVDHFVACDPCIVDHDVEGAVLLSCEVNCPANIFFDGNITVDEGSIVVAA